MDNFCSQLIDSLNAMLKMRFVNIHNSAYRHKIIITLNQHILLIYRFFEGIFYMKGILHISDLHLSHSEKFGFYWAEAEKVSSKIVDDVNSLRAEHSFSIDSIFFTGDMTFSGQQQQYELFDQHFLCPLIDKLGIQKKDVFFTPGNHDVDRSKINYLEKGLRANGSEEDISECFEIINNKEEEWKRLEGFINYNKTHKEQQKNIISNSDFFTCYKISNKLFILCINSAWLAMDDTDKEQLRITKSQIDSLNRIKIPADANIIGLTHHPLDWLNSEDREKFSTFIEKKISLLCFGHMHSFKQKLESNFSEGITLFLQAGTLDTREDNTGYSIITLNNTNDISDGRILYRKFNSELDDFEAWLERGNKGEIDFSTSNTLSFDSDKFSKISQEILEDIDKDLLINIGIALDKKKSLRNLYTEPNFLEMENTGLPTLKITSTSQIITDPYNLVLFGGHSSGRTSILKFLFIKSLELQKNKDFSEFSFYLDFKEVELKSISTIINHLCLQYSSSELTTSFEAKIKNMISDGNCVIYIDNVDKLSSKEEQIISEFFIKNKKCRFIVTAEHSSLPLITRLLTDDEKSKFYAVAIGSLRRCNVRDIVSRWHDFTSQNTIYKEITRTINNSQLPHNYFIYSMLLAIYEVDHDFKGILSESDIIENFIEILLRKHFMDTPPNKPQFKELLHFMGYLGKSLFDSRENFIDNNRLLEIAIVFNRETMHNYQVEDYITPLKECGILQKRDQILTFSQPCFLYYSIAYFMKHDSELKDEILSDENYLNLDKVIEYYSSQNASSFELLYLIQEKTKLIKESLSERMYADKKIKIEDVCIEDSNTFSLLDMVSNTKDFEKKIESLKADREKDDEKLDKIAPLKSEEKQAIIATDNSEGKRGLLNELVETLSLYSRVFRSTELSMERNKTLSIFDDLVQGYMFYLKASMVLMDESFIIPIILPYIEKKMLEDNLSEKEKDKVLEVFKLILSLARSTMPNNIQYIMSNELSSKKPRIENIISESKNSSENPVQKAILSYILMDIKEENTIKLVSELMKVKNKVVEESLFFKINQVLIGNYELSRGDEAALKEIAKRIGNDRQIIQSVKISEAIETLNNARG
ncbi:hypothetical protein Q7S_08755 [Rahnella aquatilis HX2]|nr:hypothetical protein Q7S_08755 [Rahnella aquatilis HX2]